MGTDLLPGVVVFQFSPHFRETPRKLYKCYKFLATWQVGTLVKTLTPCVYTCR